jgi:methylmalonyl-CoA/ethylmalonyl-CoA epimerase
MAKVAPGIAGLGQVNIPVADLERATTFYRDTLGMTYLFSAPPGLAFFDCGGVRLLLDAAGDEVHSRRSSILYFLVDEIRESTASLERQGVNIVSPPERMAVMADHDLWMSFFRDTEGNTLALMAEVRPPAQARS